MTRVVVEGTRSMKPTPAIVFLLILAAGIAAALAADSGSMPWLGALGRRLGALICLASFVLAWTAAWFISRRAEARFGRVELGEERILIVQGSLWGQVAWSDLVAYRDGDADFVELVPREGVRTPEWMMRLTVPTPTEKDRTAVLAALDARGLRRLDESG